MSELSKPRRGRKWVISVPPLAGPPCGSKNLPDVVQKIHEDMEGAKRALFDSFSETDWVYEARYGGWPEECQYGGCSHIRTLRGEILEEAHRIYLDLNSNGVMIEELHFVAGESGCYMVREAFLYQAEYLTWPFKVALLIKFIHIHGIHSHIGCTDVFFPLMNDLAASDGPIPSLEDSHFSIPLGRIMTRSVLLVHPCLPAPSGYMKWAWFIHEPYFYQHTYFDFRILPQHFLWVITDEEDQSSRQVFNMTYDFDSSKGICTRNAGEFDNGQKIAI
ncbi:hypothetical protein CVT26_010373 [Gymnopilus dilepis]|uniref:Uncharacterized protein n=1 Tax=Gymnopilus dilepis TaxID=231916 RepID=A0A409W512_9AGAR|nr:hypothetical protein CVT26_010373 [Gymnopilus dilepis]